MYTWGRDKSDRNLRKHGVHFSDAIGALEDPMAFTIWDPRSQGEDRFVTMGLSLRAELVVVVSAWTGREIRIISARRATPRERRQYQEG